MPPPEITLSPQDTYILARALVGLDWASLPVGPAAALLLANLDPTSRRTCACWRRVLGSDLLRTILAVDPHGEPPKVDPHTDLNVVPPLPDAAQLSAEQVTQAQSCRTVAGRLHQLGWTRCQRDAVSFIWGPDCIWLLLPLGGDFTYAPPGASRSFRIST